MVDLIAQPESVEEEKPRRDLFAWAWRGLGNPLLLVGVSILLLLVLLMGLAIPQMPGQYADDAAASSRWLLTTQAEYGSLGSLLAGLGLFDLLHSPLLRFGMFLVGLLLFIQLGDQLVNLERHRKLPTLLAAPVSGPGEPIPLPGTLPIYRWRTALDRPPDEMAAVIDSRLSSHFAPDPAVTLRDLRVPIPGLAGEESQTTETRWLVQGRTWAAVLRPLFLLGILVVLAVLWVSVVFGWAVTPPVLAPGEAFHFPRRGLTLTYSPGSPAAGEGDQTAVLQVQIGDASKSLPVAQGSYARLNNASIWVERAAPGLFLSSEGGATFLLPGQSRASTSQGFVFPAPGSEESVLIPEAGVGVRMVRLPDEDAFLLEVIGSGQGDAVQRLEIRGDENLSLPLVQGERAGEEATLGIHFLPGLQVRVRYMPGDWLLWLGVALIVIGALGYWRRPFFTLVQLSPWPRSRSVLVVQSDAPEPLRMLGKEEAA
ncbi:MAG: hypothetical protein D6790_02090 [Caldilineae bacterium]|nr:MAG: hypothetical protein D6790_02090 [Caldilineae bacterium]